MQNSLIYHYLDFVALDFYKLSTGVLVLSHVKWQFPGLSSKKSNLIVLWLNGIEDLFNLQNEIRPAVSHIKCPGIHGR